MIRSNLLPWFSSVFCLGLILGCASKEEITGNTSVTTNGISAIVTKPKGSLAVRSHIILSSTNSSSLENPVVQIDSTDKNGVFNFEGLEPGLYTLEIQNSDSSLGIVVDSIRVTMPDAETFVHISLDTVQLKETGQITLPLARKGFLGDVCAGFENVSTSECTVNDTLVMTKVSKGKRRLSLIWEVTEGSKSRSPLPEFNFDNEAELVLDTVDVPQTGLFQNRLTITLDLTGIPRSQEILNYPLHVTVQNTGSQFAEYFTAMNMNPNLFQIFSELGDLLPLQVERMDLIVGEVDIWIRVPSIPINLDTYTFYLAYNPAGTAFAPSEVVFDSSVGFQAAWSMNEATEDYGPYSLPVSWAAPVSTTTGVLGSALQLSNNSGQVDLTGHQDFLIQPEAITVEAWIAPDVTPFYIFQVSSGNLSDQIFSRFLFNTTVGDQLSIGYRDSVGTLIRLTTDPSNFAAGNWVHVAGVMDPQNDLLELYINGELANSQPVAGFPTPFFESVSAASVVIGSEDDGTVSAEGRMDNIFVSSRVRSADWFRLNYALQSPGSARVQIVAE